MAPTFNSDKRMSLGTNQRVRVSGAPKSPCPWTRRSERFARRHAARIVSVPLCFFANPLKLFLKTSQIFVGKFFQIDKFISSAFQRSDYFVEFQMSRFGIAILRILNEKDH